MDMNGEEAVTRYIRQRVALGDYAPSTARSTGILLRSWLRHVADWTEPTPDEVVEWVTVPASADGKHRRESCLRRFYRWAYTHRWIAVDVTPLVPTIRGSDKRPKPIPDDVLARVMGRACRQDRDALTLGRFAGLRASEIAATHSDHLTADGLYVLGKGGRERWVQVNPQVRRVFMAAPGGFVFPSQNGQTMSKRLGKVLPPPWTAHCLRHAFATDLYARTLDLAVVAEQLGHKSTQTTERYVQVRNEKARAAVAAMTLGEVA